MNQESINDNNKFVNPYKEFRPYNEDDEKYFAGREKEKKRLLRLVKNNFLTVVYGKSGIGKTSLLKAGLFPQLRRDGFLPLLIRVNYGEPELIEQARRLIADELNNNDIITKDENGEIEGFKQDETLWGYFHRAMHFHRGNKSEKPITPVIVLDQFEELFTVGKNHSERDDWLKQLFYLVEDEIPESLRKRILEDEEDFPYLEKSIDLRIIISLREDFLPHFTGLIPRIPSIDRSKFRVVHFDKTQAEKVINLGFKDEDSVDKILQSINQTGESNQFEVDPISISLLCYQLFKKLEIKAITKKTQKELLRDFYDSILKDYPPKLESLIEEKLLTDEGDRTLCAINQDPSLIPEINKLIERGLFRRVHYGEKEYFELIHDVLADTVKEKRKIKVNVRRIKKVNIFFQVTIIFALLILLFINSLYNTNTKSKVNIAELTITSFALQEFYTDNTRAIRFQELAYKNGLPTPLARTSQILSWIGYSSFDRPFYVAEFKHDQPVYRAIFSKDGKNVLTVSEDHTAKLWDTRTGESIPLLGHQDRIMYAEFSPSPQNKYILTASWDKTAMLWDDKGRKLTEFKHNGPVTFATFSSNGDRVLTSSRDNTAKVWDLSGNHLDTITHTADVISGMFSHDGTKVLTASWDKTVKIRDLKSDDLEVLNHEGALNSAVFSPDGSRILSASSNGGARIFDISGKELLWLPHPANVSSAKFSHDGKMVLTACDDGYPRLWRLKETSYDHLEAIQTSPFDKHHGEITSAEFSKDGQKIVTASRDGVVKLWDLESNLLAKLDKFNHIVYSAYFSPNGKEVLTACESGSVKVWSLENKILSTLKGHTAEIYSAVYSPTGDRILTASYDRSAKLWDSNGKLVTTLSTHRNAVTSALFSPDGERILTTSLDHRAKLWDKEGNFLRDLPHNDAVAYAVFSKDSSKIVTVSEDKTTKLWDKEGNLSATLRQPPPRTMKTSELSPDSKTVFAPAFSPDGNHVITAASGYQASVLDLTGRVIATLSGHMDTIRSAAYSPDGQVILTASFDKTARLLDLKGELIKTLDQHTGKLSSAVFSHNGEYILTCSWDKTAMLWEADGDLIKTFVGHKKQVLTARFSMDDKYIITASEDHTAKLWNIQGGLLADLKNHKGAVNSAVFSHDGSRLLTASRDGTAKVWMTPNAIFEWLKKASIPQLTKADKGRLGIQQ